MVAGVSSADAVQPDVYDYNVERSQKLQAISSALDKINGRMGADTIMLSPQLYRDKGADGKSVSFDNAIRRAMKSPDYTTRLGAFVVK